MRHAILAIAFAAAFALPAQAAVEFKVIEIPEGNVIEFDVIAVNVPSRLPNYCAVSAMVRHVWQGAAYRAGQPIALNVPCAELSLIPANVWNDGFLPVNARSLRQSTHGIARLDDKGELMWNSAGGRQYGMWGLVAGYRVLDARMIPLKPTES